MKASGCSIMLLSPPKEHLVIVGAHGLSDLYLRKGALNVHKSLPEIMEGEIVSITNISNDIRAQYPEAAVVCYVNSTADVKAESDVCCTSGNARAVVESLKCDTVIFLPDEYMAGNVAKETNRHIIFPTRKNGENNNLDYQMIGWHGRCEVHERFTVEDIVNVRRQFPDVAILAHPECSPEVVDASDYSASTSAMIKFVQETDKPQYLLLTECAMGDNIAAENPDKEILGLCSLRCPYMNMITLEETLSALQNNQYRIEVPEEIRIRAARSVERMIQVG